MKHFKVFLCRMLVLILTASSVFATSADYKGINDKAYANTLTCTEGSSSMLSGSSSDVDDTGSVSSSLSEDSELNSGNTGTEKTLTENSSEATGDGSSADNSAATHDGSASADNSAATHDSSASADNSAATHDGSASADNSAATHDGSASANNSTTSNDASVSISGTSSAEESAGADAPLKTAESADESDSSDVTSFVVEASSEGETVYSSGKTAVTTPTYPRLKSLANKVAGVQVSWKAVTDAKKYYIYYKTTGTEWVLSGKTQETKFVVTGLTGGVNYIFTVRANSKFDSNTADSEAATLTDITAQTDTNTVTQINTNSSTQTSSNTNTQVSSNAGTQANTTTGTQANSTTSATATAGTTGQTTATTATIDYSKWYRSITFVVAPKITSTTVSGTNVTLKWNKSAGATWYRVFYSLDQSTWTIAGETKKASYTIENLKNNRRYYFTVRCINPTDNTNVSSYYTNNSSYIIGTIYSPYTGVDYTKQTTSDVRLKAMEMAKKMTTVTWTAPCSFVTWNGSSGVYNSAQALDGTRSTMFIKGKEYAGIPYSMYNRTYNLSNWKKLIASGFSSSSMAASYYSGNPKGTAKGIDCSSFVYQTVKASGVAGDVYNMNTYGMLSSSYYKVIDWYELEPGDILLVGGHVMVYAGRTDKGLCAVFEATCYGSKCAYNEYSFSSLYSRGYRPYRFKNYPSTMTAEKPEYQMSTLSLSAKGANVTLSWNTVQYVRQYQIQYRENGGKWKTWVKKSYNESYFTVANGINYEFRVRCVSCDGKTALSGWSNVVSKYYLYKVQVNTVKALKNKLKVTWTAQSMADSYELQISRYADFRTKETTTVNARTSNGALKTKLSYTWRKLKKGKVYYIRIRCTAKLNEQTKHSAWTVYQGKVK